MKFISFPLTLFLALNWTAAARAVCSSNLLIDDYSRYSSNKNSVGQWTGGMSFFLRHLRACLIYRLDDGTTTNLKADTVNKKITFTASASSYFYTTFSCEKAMTLGYNSITFPIKGPSGATFTLELQTMKSCSATAYTSYYYAVPTVMTGGSQTITVPLSSFPDANFNAIGALLFESFTLGAWEIGVTQFVCANKAQSSSASPSSSKVQAPIVSSSSSAQPSNSVAVTTMSRTVTTVSSSVSAVSR
jgi:hypothetical protein